MAGRYDQAELHFSMAHELNPNSPTTLAPCAHGISYSGNRAKARELAEAAAKLNPALSAFQWGYIACIRFFDQDFDSSLEAFDNAHGVITDLVGWRAAAEAMQGKEDLAKITGQKFLDLVRTRWQSDEPANDANIMSWFLHCFPIRRKEDQNLLKNGLQRAGLPVT